MTRHIIYNIACLLAPFAATAAPQLTATIDSAAVEMGSYATITLDIADPAHGGVLVDLPGDDTRAGALDFTKVTADTFPGGYQYRMLIQAFEPGEVTFPPFRYAAGTDTFASNAVTLKILPVALDTTQTTINPMASTVNPPRRWYDWIPDWLLWVVVGLAVVAIAVALALIYRKHGTLIPHTIKPVDPYEAALQQLDRLRQSRMAESGRDKEYYTALIDILRTYLDRRFGINAMEMSSTQILHSLNDNPETRGDQPRIRRILQTADYVKFANERPLADDNIKAFNTVHQFVLDTKPAPADEGESKPKE